MYGVEPEVQSIGETDNRLVRMLAQTPTRLVDIDEPGFLRPDWVVTRPRLVGICGSESKAVFLDYASLTDPAASGPMQNPMKRFVSFPHVMGHEVIAEVVAVGPEAEGLEPGDRVALNPWLTCVTRGVSPICPACVAGDLSQCHSFAQGRVRPRHPHRHVRRRDRGVRRPDAGARLDALQGAGRPQRRAGRPGRPVRRVAPRRHPPSAAAGEQGARLRCRRPRPVRRRHPGGAAPDGRGDGGGPVRRAAPAGRGLRRVDRAPRAAAGAHRAGGGLVGRRAAAGRRAPHGLPGRHRRGLRHDRGGRDAGGRLPRAAGPGDPGEAGHARRRQMGRHAGVLQGDRLHRAPTPSGSRRSRVCASTASPTSWTWSDPAGST